MLDRTHYFNVLTLVDLSREGKWTSRSSLILDKSQFLCLFPVPAIPVSLSFTGYNNITINKHGCTIQTYKYNELNTKNYQKKPTKHKYDDKYIISSNPNH